MSKNGLNDYVGHIIEAVQMACVYIDGLSKDDFLADKRTQQAVIPNIVVIGEAATRIVKDHSEFIDQYPDVPWKEMR